MKLLLFQFGSEWLILETNDFHLKIPAKLSKYHFINMSVFYIAMSLESFIHIFPSIIVNLLFTICSCGLKNTLTKLMQNYQYSNVILFTVYIQ